jgi:hypothetical protein
MQQDLQLKLILNRIFLLHQIVANDTTIFIHDFTITPADLKPANRAKSIAASV